MHLSSSNPVILNSQLNWLLAADPHPSVPLHSQLQPRALSLPLAQQQDLVLAAAYLLLKSQQDLTASSSQQHSSVAFCAANSQLLQLLAVLSNASKPFGHDVSRGHHTLTQHSNAVTQTACWALQQQQQHAVSSTVEAHR